MSLLVACASATYYGGYNGYNGYNGYAPHAGYSASQFHSQDEYGQANFGYSYPGQASTTHRDAYGNQAGSYAYINAEGKEVRVSYVADANGFRVVSNDLPQGPGANTLVGPAPVQDTPVSIRFKCSNSRFNVLKNEIDRKGILLELQEVAAAKAEFFKMYKEAAAAAAAAPDSRKKRGILAAPLSVVPAYAKTTIKTAYYEKDLDAKTPADTTKINLKEKEQQVLTPVAYSYPAYTYPAVKYVAAAPITKLFAAPYYY